MEKETEEFEVDEETLSFYNQWTKQNLSKEELLAKGKTVRENAIQIKAYRCIRLGRFLTSRLAQHPKYKENVKPILAEAKILDIGCCLGTDLRRVALDGAQMQNLIGVDLNDFFTLGLSLFGDEEKVKEKILFVQTDALTEDFPSKLFHLLQEKRNSSSDQHFDVVSVGSVFHLLLEDQTKSLAVNVAKLLKPNGILIGQTVGKEKEGNYIPGREEWKRNEGEKSEGEKKKEGGGGGEGAGSNPPGLRFLHSPSSLASLFSSSGFENIWIEWARTPEGEKHGMLTFFATKK
eukprot:TRINITY_DN2367_c0_g1_i3.p1 TRINITY_DN2367_c0_g1~~TRINITY_DN2367_c0_g1_i3.p1  ORF type:complete len:323 (-),score=119.48 TRINITY_DN2367_c0_g1_i3:254-1126(-)